jgi:hypothetical protein
MGQRPKHLKKSNTFPRLAKKRNKVTSNEDKTYNCIAYAAGRTDKKIWPTFHPDHYWPPSVPRADELTSLVNLFSSLGYARCGDGSFEAGFEKVAIYVHPVTGRPTHAARQISPGKWASKLGEWFDIEHTVDAVSGGDYGEMSVFLKRATQT